MMPLFATYIPSMPKTIVALIVQLLLFGILARALFAAVGKPPRLSFIDTPAAIRPRCSRCQTISTDGWSSVCAATTQAGRDARWQNTPGAPSTFWPGCCPRPDLPMNLSNLPLIGAAEPVTI